MGVIHVVKTSIKHALDLRVIAFKMLSKLATLIDIRNTFLTRKINKPLELKAYNFWPKKKLLKIGPSQGFLNEKNV